MIELIETKRGELQRLCRKHRVRRLEVFGSAAGDEFDPKKSDIDFLVEFQRQHPSEHADAYFGMLEMLEKLLGRHVDLIEVRAVNNPYFLESINRNRKVVYNAV